MARSTNKNKPTTSSPTSSVSPTKYEPSIPAQLESLAAKVRVAKIKAAADKEIQKVLKASS